ncbi:hypothetical protein VTN96DRAFT_8764 [Rasamsonia emersonii]
MGSLVMVGACYLDTILTVDHYPDEDEKLRASSVRRRRGGNCPNSVEVFQQLLDSSPEHNEISLNLAAVLPARSSVGSQQIKASFGPRVNLQHCIYREAFNEPASSYIIKSQSTGSRTIVNYNELPEMTVAEFVQIADQLVRTTDDWFHFEGRIPDVTLQCMQYLRQRHPAVRISVEVEKPGRAGLQELAAGADVVFYAKGWAQANGYRSPEEFLRAQAQLTPKARYLCCTWGEEGAAIMDLADRNTPTYESTPAYTVAHGQVVDTIGAGDTFIAGMLYSLLCHPDDWDLSRKLRFANELAGRKVFQEGFTGLGDAMRHHFES